MREAFCSTELCVLILLKQMREQCVQCNQSERSLSLGEEEKKSASLRSNRSNVGRVTSLTHAVACIRCKSEARVTTTAEAARKVVTLLSAKVIVEVTLVFVCVREKIVYVLRNNDF